MAPIFFILLATLFSGIVGFWAYRRKSISKSGLLALILICALFIGLQQFIYLGILFSMFASSSLWSKYKKAQKAELDLVVAKNGPRDAFQAFANLGVAVLAYILFAFTEDIGFIYAFLGSVAASNADSWASEIGGLSKEAPRMITSFKPVEKGISGGVTLLGTFGGILGALFISVWAVFIPQEDANSTSYLFLVASLSGISGFMFDSILGATLQAKYKNTKQHITEQPIGNTLVAGLAWINNDMVNLLSSLMAGIFAYGLYTLVQ